MNPIVNTRRDSTQSGVDRALSSTPHGTSPISFRRFGRSRASRMWRSLHQEVVCGNTLVTIGSAGAFVELGRPLPIRSRLFGPASEGLTGSIPQSRVDFSKDRLSRETRVQQKQGGPKAQ